VPNVASKALENDVSRFLRTSCHLLEKGLNNGKKLTVASETLENEGFHACLAAFQKGL